MQRIKKLLDDKKPLTWIFYGDSITHGAFHTFGWRDYPELFAERVRSEIGRPMDMVITSAISGDNTQGLLNSFDWRVARFKPDVVFIMIGMNDCAESCPVTLEDFTRNLRELADKTNHLGAIPVLQTTCPILPGQAPDRALHLPSYMEAVREVASAGNWPLIDHDSYWQQNLDKLFYWMSNAFHPNENGHRVFTRTIFESLDILDDENSATCRLFVP